LQVKKADIQKVFRKPGLEVRSTKHTYGWLIVDDKKIIIDTGPLNIPAFQASNFLNGLDNSLKNWIVS